MGIDSHALHLLRYAAAARPFGATITIGRQELHVDNPILAATVPGGDRHFTDRYCEPLLRDCFGADAVESIDNSPYERASHVHDFNRPLPDALRGRYDTVVDGGSLEHIYNVPQALENCSALCRPGGQVLHVLPANNQCGHGFWQFSPELFFSLYSTANGYADTEVFIADLADTTRWFKVNAPAKGRRVDIASATELYVLVRTVLPEGRFSHDNVQQSDYIQAWGRDDGPLIEIRKPQTPHPLRRWAQRSTAFQRFVVPWSSRARLRSAAGLRADRADLQEISLLQKPGARPRGT